MTTPTLVAQLALSTRPTEAPQWIDVTDRVRRSTGIHVSRGRTQPGEANETGTATCSLDNRDRALDPSYQGAAFNLVTNPQPDPGGATTGWYGAVGSGSYALANVADATDPDAIGSRALRWVYTGATDCAGYTALGNVASGRLYHCIGRLKATLDCTITIDLRRDITPYDVVSNQAVVNLTANEWTPIYVALTATQDCAARYRLDFGDVPVDLISRGLGSDGTLTVWARNVAVDPYDATYYDGSQGDCRWDGAAHASATYRGGPYYGQLKPMRRFRVAAIYDGVEYPLLTGYVDGFTQQWPGGLDAVVPIRALDGFRVLALNELIAQTFAEQLSSDRINAILDATGWTTGGTWVLDSGTNSQLGTTTILAPVTGDRVILTGDTTVQADTIEKTNALEYCQQIERAENGRLFVNGAGAVCFFNRHYLYDPAQQVSRWTFVDAVNSPDGLPYADLETAYDDGDLYNTVACTRRNGAVQTATDAASALDYFARALSETDLLAASDADMADRAAWTLSRRKAPGYRVKSLTIKPQADDRLWPAVLGAELGDRITVSRTPQGLGDPWSADYQVEHIETTIQDGFWTVVWQLSPADVATGVAGNYDGTQTYWHISNGSDEYAAYAVLGVTTTLGY